MSNELALPDKLENALPVRLRDDKAWLEQFQKSFSSLKPEEQMQVTSCFVPTEADADASFGDFVGGSNTWSPAYIRLVQRDPDPPVEGLKVGDLIVDGAFPLKPPVAIIPIGFWKTRTLWDREAGGNKPICKSYNSVVGTAYGECDKCQFNSTFNSSVEKTKKCTLQMNMSAVIPGMWNKIFYFSFHGSNFMFGQKLYKRVSTKSTPKFLFTHHITTRKEKGTGFTYHVFDLDTKGTVNTPKEFYPLLRAYQYKSGIFVEDQVKRGQKGEEVQLDKLNGKEGASPAASGPGVFDPNTVSSIKDSAGEIV